MTTDLAAWLLEQIAEDEQVARGAIVGPWMANADGDEVVSLRGPEEQALLGEDLVIATGYALGNRQLRANVAHIARWDPARVLAEVAAKRLQVAQMFRYEAKIDGEWGCCHSAAEIEAGDCDATPVDEIMMLQLLALPYAGRPGYLDEWKPDTP